MTNFHVSDGHSVILRPNFVPSISVMAHQWTWRVEVMNTFSKYQNLNVSSNFLPVLLFQHCAAFPLRQAHYSALLNGCLHVQPPCRGVAQLAASVLLCPKRKAEKNTFMDSNGTKKGFAPFAGWKKPIFFSSRAQWPAPSSASCIPNETEM